MIRFTRVAIIFISFFIIKEVFTYNEKTEFSIKV